MSEAGQSRSILVVDDEPTLRMAFSFALTDALTEVEEAADGDQALAKLAHRRFDLVLMDLRMPVLNGLETVARLRARGDHSPVVMCSAHLIADDALAALRHGVVDFLTKPVELGRLRKVVGDVLRPQPGLLSKAFAHARRMEFREALEVLLPAARSEEAGIWCETFRSLACPDLQPGGFFDSSTGRARVERLMQCS
ncbi:MAG: response regulator [Luteolibacter sp.]